MIDMDFTLKEDEKPHLVDCAEEGLLCFKRGYYLHINKKGNSFDVENCLTISNSESCLTYEYDRYFWDKRMFFGFYEQYITHFIEYHAGYYHLIIDEKTQKSIKMFDSEI